MRDGLEALGRHDMFAHILQGVALSLPNREFHPGTGVEIQDQTNAAHTSFLFHLWLLHTRLL